MTAKGLSLHIGVSRVSAALYGLKEADAQALVLPACERDASRMAALAAEKRFATTVVLTYEATAKRILGEIASAAGFLSPGDMFFVSFSGHGGQLPDDVPGEAPDEGGEQGGNLDDTWVAYDQQIRDDTLRSALAQFPAGVRIVAVSDSCHSGTILDEELWAKAMPRAVAEQDYRRRADVYARPGPAARRGEDDRVTPVQASVAQISACRDEQVAAAIPQYSLLTDRFVHILSGDSFRGDYNALLAELDRRLPERQNPVLTPIGGPGFLSERPLAI